MSRLPCSVAIESIGSPLHYTGQSPLLYITMGVQALEKAHKGFSMGIDVYHSPIGIPVQWIQFVVGTVLYTSMVRI